MVGRSRRVALTFGVVVLVLAGCRVPGQWFPGHGFAEPSGVRIVVTDERHAGARVR